METVSRLFDRMDSWRHFPCYQLERRADIFFSLYLPEALEAKLGFPIEPALIPEFPVRIGTIYPNIPINKSFKIDYLALSASGERAVFVELKTEGLSRRPEQDSYLVAAQDAGLSALLEGLLLIFRATNSKRKYFRLLDALGQMGLLEIPSSMHEIMFRGSLQGIDRALDQLRITCSVKQCHVIYVQPNGEGPDIISFSDFSTVVQAHNDPISNRFAQSLGEWASVSAGGIDGSG